MRNDDVPKMKKPHVTMQAARLRVLRTSRLFLLPAIALSLTACTENAVADAVTDIRQKADEMRGSANAVFDPAATLADSRRYDDDRDDRDDDRDDDDDDRDDRRRAKRDQDRDDDRRDRRAYRDDDDDDDDDDRRRRYRDRDRDDDRRRDRDDDDDR